jgi:tetratricopeptide (TPR) repeat protein
VERAAPDAQSPTVDNAPQLELLWNLLRLELTAAGDQPVEKTVARLIELRPDAASQFLTRVAGWITEAENWPALERVAGQFRDPLTATKRGGYALALARHKQGRDDLADAAADAAFEQPAVLQVTANGLDERLILGKQLLDEGLTDWGRRELRAAIEEKPAISRTGIVSRWILFESLFDREEYAESADLLAKLNVEMSETAENRRELKRLLQDQQGFIPAAETLRAREAFSRALVARRDGNHEEELKHLQAAIAADPGDADVLIALHRAGAAAPEVQQKTLKMIDELSQTFQQQIEENPDDPTNFNQWAWLISNTVGDYEKAIRYSQRSLQLQPDDAGYLDTLGRCYFAAGDLENAVKTQRRAVDKMPHMHVMQRQLKLFEESLAAKERQQPAASGQ